MFSARKLAVAFLFVSILAVVSPSLGRRERTPTAKAHPVIDAISNALDGMGIDTVRGDTASVPLDGRPRVALLRTIPVKEGRVQEEPWMQDFISGQMGAVTAIRLSHSFKTIGSADFLKLWKLSPRDRKVFLSFTRVDLPIAQKVVAALQAEGFLTYIFLNEQGKIQYGADTSGDLFREAGHHLVIDTLEARRSKGVWLEANLAKVVIGKEEFFLPRKEPPDSSSSVSLPVPSGIGPRGGSGALSESLQYQGPRISVERLRNDPVVFGKAGGIMFGMPSTPTNLFLRPNVKLRYDAKREDGNRLTIATPTRSLVVKGIPDSVLLPTAAFVDEGRPVAVNLQIPVGAGNCKQPPATLRVVELHPAFLNTAIGNRLVRADTMVWPVLIPSRVNASGETFDIERLPSELRSQVQLLRSRYEASVRLENSTNTSLRRISNINDVLRPARFSVGTETDEVRTSGVPSFEILKESKEGNSSKVVVQTEESELLTANQAKLFRTGRFLTEDSTAYSGVVAVYRTAGLLHFMKANAASSWREFMATLPDISRTSTTPAVLCPRCGIDQLFGWIATCSTISKN